MPFVDWDEATYNSDTEYERSTTLKHITGSHGPRGYYLKCREPAADTKELLLGRLFHSFVLEGKQLYFIFDGRRGTKAHTEAVQKHQLPSLTPVEHMILQAMAQAVRNNPRAKWLLECSAHEQTALWERDDIKRKARFDIVLPDGTVADIKTTTATTPEAFGNAVVKYQYHLSAALYLDGIETLTGQSCDNFCWIMVSKTAPFWSYVIPADGQLLDWGRREYLRALELLTECRQREADYVAQDKPAIEAWPDPNVEFESTGLTIPAWQLS